MSKKSQISLLAVAFILGAHAEVDAALEQGLKLLERGRTLLSEKDLTEARDHFAALAQQAGNAVYSFQEARANQYLCEALAAHGDKKNAERALDAAIDNVQLALRLNEKSAEAHSLLADLYGRKITLGSAMFAGPKYGPKLKAENKRALELDPRSPRVFASLGREHLQAPRMFGGDIDRAIEDFQESVELDPKSDETFVWLALALRKKGDASGVGQALHSALDLNPQSVFALETAGKKN
jgi:Flp pilus assembly protein TadD